MWTRAGEGACPTGEILTTQGYSSFSFSNLISELASKRR